MVVVVIPRYNQFQYGIKKYGKYESIKENQEKIFLAKGRIRIRSGSSGRFIYYHPPVKIEGPFNRFRLSTNQDEQIYSQSLRFKGDPITIRMMTNEREPIISTRKQV